jgi:uncharacterized protein YecE (DUF72 family)
METEASGIRIGIAGWALEKGLQPLFPPEGTHLQRYAGRFDLVEINSSFYRPHKPDTYRRWAAGVPADFRFSAKVPKEITHARRLRAYEEPLDRFLSEVGGLGDKLGPLLIQLPPSGAFEPSVAEAFLRGFRERYPGLLAMEPRHASWMSPEAQDLLREFRIAQVAADPEVIPGGGKPGGWDGFAYWRLHGSPRTYYSPYTETFLGHLAESIEDTSGPGPIFCIFDNTAEGHAIPDALRLMEIRGKGILAGG